MGLSMAWVMWGSALGWLAINLILIAEIWPWWIRRDKALHLDDPGAILLIRAQRGEISAQEYEDLRALLQEDETSSGGEEAHSRVPTSKD